MKITKETEVECLSKSITMEILNSQREDSFFLVKPWLNKTSFLEVCYRYGYPEKDITVVIDNYYIDVAYRDVYYSYWSSLHFDWPRYCKRIMLFVNRHDKQEFFLGELETDLQNDFIGTIVIRPSYSSETNYTFGKTLLNTEIEINEEVKYMKKARYTATLLGNTYTVDAFPFSNQDGVAMKCAETAIYNLFEFAAHDSARHALVLPSQILDTLKHKTAERILPSHGLYCSDISFILKEYGYSPMIYAGIPDKGKASGDSEEQVYTDTKIGLIGSSSVDEVKVSEGFDVAHEQQTDFKKWFHYYVESGIPLLAITFQNQEVDKHAVLVIGHSSKKRDLNACKIQKLGNLPCIDTAELYNEYVIQDDNQIPYVVERMDKFSKSKNFKLDAFIAPLEKHLFLEASAAVSICDGFIAEIEPIIAESIEQIKASCESNAIDADTEIKEQYEWLKEALVYSDDNPLTIRYYLANGSKFKKFRISNSVGTEQSFYADALMPKSVWIAEISTFRLYEEGLVFAEIVIDATASNQSKNNSIILLRSGNHGVYRLPDETYNDFLTKLKELMINPISGEYADMDGFFELYSNFEYNYESKGGVKIENPEECTS